VYERALTGPLVAVRVLLMKIERVQLFDGEEIIFVWTSKRRYVRITTDTVSIHRLKKGHKK